MDDKAFDLKILYPQVYLRFRCRDAGLQTDVLPGQYPRKVEVKEQLLPGPVLNHLYWCSGHFRILTQDEDAPRLQVEGRCYGRFPAAQAACPSHRIRMLPVLTLPGESAKGL